MPYMPLGIYAILPYGIAIYAILPSYMPLGATAQWIFAFHNESSMNVYCLTRNNGLKQFITVSEQQTEFNQNTFV